MTSSRTFERWTTIAALFVLISQILLLSAPARAAAGPGALLQPTPLVLKDGRIANVSIHVLPFDNGQGELTGNVASRLGELTATVATDCFLTAQVIGHVSSREVADNETLAAHRLARARADAVQASLIGGGLPAKAIASVWDWQFLVREPRATLWVFRLVQGEDCEGLPLDGNGSQLVAGGDAGQTASAQAAPAREIAQAPTPAETPRSAEAQPPAEAPRSASPAPRAEVDQAASGSDLPGVVGSAAAAEATSRAERAEVAAAPPRSGDAAAKAQERDARQAAPAGPAADAVPMLTRPLPALSPAQPVESRGVARDRQPTGDTKVAAVEPGPATAGGGSQRAAAGKAAQPAGAAAATQPSAVPQDPERQGKVEWGQDNVVITFATNSSYFPPGTARRLASLLGDMAADGRYRVRLEVGVSGSDTVVGATSPEEARRYNRWLAERRLSRVREWLDENASDRQLEIEPAFQPDDNSRRVVVRVAPVS
jgi:outer membrane protein OmpA-like peptidoglycan-associated protein